MIIGTGQLAKIFNIADTKNAVIFASGVSNSNCIDVYQFQREENLLRNALEINNDKIFVYFSSAALSAHNYPKNDYYTHKQKMENIIKKNSNQYYIFRIPQLFGKLKIHPTIINFIYESILNDRKFNVYSDAYRYVIEIDDVKTIVHEYLKHSDPCVIVDIANNYRYKVLEIVAIFENLLGKKGNYDIVEHVDNYLLDLSNINKFIKDNNIDINFTKDYLFKKLQEKILLQQ